MVELYPSIEIYLLDFLISEPKFICSFIFKLCTAFMKIQAMLDPIERIPPNFLDFIFLYKLFTKTVNCFK